MKYQSALMTHNDGGMHHLGIKEKDIAKSVILTPDPMMIEYFARFMDSGKIVGDYREYVTFTGLYQGKPLSIMSSGFGCMPMAIAVEELKHLNVEKLIKIDGNVSIDEDLKCGEFIACHGAVRGEGASKEYIDLAYPAVGDMSLLGNLLAEDIKIGLFRSHDCENVESPYAPKGMEKIKKWSDLGVEVLDGETSSMYIVSACLKIKALSLSIIKENYLTNEKIQISEKQYQKLFNLAANCLIR